MDVSYELVSSMSPKIKNKLKPGERRFRRVAGASILALKKNIRRSSLYEKPVIKSQNKQIHVGVYEQTFSLVSDRESKNTKKKSEPIHLDKFDAIKNWIENVQPPSPTNSTTNSTFADLSTICGTLDNDNFIPAYQKGAVNSTFLSGHNIKINEVFTSRNKREHLDDEKTNRNNINNNDRKSTIQHDGVKKLVENNEHFSDLIVIDDSFEYQSKSFNNSEQEIKTENQKDNFVEDLVNKYTQKLSLRDSDCTKKTAEIRKNEKENFSITFEKDEKSTIQHDEIIKCLENNQYHSDVIVIDDSFEHQSKSFSNSEQEIKTENQKDNFVEDLVNKCTQKLSLRDVDCNKKTAKIRKHDKENSSITFNKTPLKNDKVEPESFIEDYVKDSHERFKSSSPVSCETSPISNGVLQKHCNKVNNKLIVDELFENTDYNLKANKDKLTPENKTTVFQKTPVNDFSNITVRKPKNRTNQPQKTDAAMADFSPETQKLLDELYGNSWRKNDVSKTETKKKINTDKVLPKTEIKPRKSVIHKNPYLDLEKAKSQSLLNTLEKSRKKYLSWYERVKNVCDSDSDSSYENIPGRKLEFDKSDDEQELSKKSKNIKKNHTTKENKKNINKKSKAAFLDDSESEEEWDNEISTRKSMIIQRDDGNFSFLASLSANIPITKCDMSARIFRNNFQRFKDELTQRLFKLFNTEIFEEQLPDNMTIQWSNTLRKTAGTTRCVSKRNKATGIVNRYAEIVLSSKVIDSAERLRDTLIHELCHAVTFLVNNVHDGHGSFWKSWARRAMNKFPELPPIQRCHNYAIKTKYTYKCTNCGYSIGRHSKSLDTERKRCGYCYGKFEVFINKSNKKGEIKIVPTPKKEPTAFALYVKENYSAAKTPDRKHAEVMRVLGEQFKNANTKN